MAGRECAGEHPAGRWTMRRWDGLCCALLTLLSHPTLQTWTSVPSTAFSVTTGGAETALVATAAPAPRVSASGRTQRPVKVQGPGRTARGIYTHRHTHMLCMVCTHRHILRHVCCMLSIYIHALIHTACCVYIDTRLLKDACIPTLTHIHTHTQRHIYLHLVS